MGRGAEQGSEVEAGAEDNVASGLLHPCTSAPAAGFSVGAGDMVWNALIIVTVLLPLSGLAIDIPRYFALRSRLQGAVDAAAEAAARQVDIPHFMNTGEPPGPGLPMPGRRTGRLRRP